MLPSLFLTALPKKNDVGHPEYWAPFNIATGASSSEWQKFGPDVQAHLISVRLAPHRLLWASTKSSVWPSENIAKVVLPGVYSLQARIEIKGGKTVLSNEVRVMVLK